MSFPFRSWFFLGVLSLLLPRLAADAPSAAPAPAETMAERTLKDILRRQKILLEDAARAGDNKLDQDSVKVQLLGLMHEYQALTDSDPTFWPAFADYGYFLSKLNQRDLAMKTLLKADELNPEIPMVKNQLGNILAEDGKPLEAIDYYQAAARLDPTEPLYPYQIGQLLYVGRDTFLGQGGYTRQEWDDAMQGAFRKAAELAPDRIEFAYRYAESYYDLAAPDWNQAFATWQALEARAGSPVERQTYLLHEANIRLKQGRPADAKAILAQVTDPGLATQKQKLVAELPENAKK